MRRQRYSATRNKLDLNNRVQVRILKKRLKVSDKQLAGLVQKAGTSIAALRKEADLQRLVSVPPAEVIASTQETAVEQTVEERIAV